ncbi:hypothetical protein PoB_006065300 [Plakobranchus ocellatus]|uniref:Uncharacterized protein n=1 Tax=Plakobranchus ocellatus TaxID=259542 RepID=A0AAV4CQG4_9GAST|nr:hypothetical protein PoB_006065300 [Plakobranchus ocellatus]
MFDLYKSSLVDNSLLEAQCRELQDKIKQYEANHQWDPRLLKVLLIAERHRQEKAHVHDEKNELEAEVIDMTIEQKHMEDVLKNKNKDVQKMQDELRKARDMEKQVEMLETSLMQKDYELHALQESYDALIVTNIKLESHKDTPKMSLFTLEDQKSTYGERDMMIKFELAQADKLALKADIEAKNRQIYLINKEITKLKIENDELERMRRETQKSLSKMQSENNRLLNDFSSLQKKMAILREQLDQAKSEIVALKKMSEACEHSNISLTHSLNSKDKEAR